MFICILIEQEEQENFKGKEGRQEESVSRFWEIDIFLSLIELYLSEIYDFEQFSLQSDSMFVE